jgi:hypothetical protein
MLASVLRKKLGLAEDASFVEGVGGKVESAICRGKKTHKKYGFMGRERPQRYYRKS